MGQSSSSNTMKSTLESVNENIFKVVSNISNSASSSCTSNQVQSVDIDTITNKGCDLSFLQTATVNCGLMASFSSMSMTDLKAILDQAVDNSAKASNDTVQNFLSASMSDSTNNVDVKTYVKNLIDREFKYDTSTTCISDLKSSQTQPIKIKNLNIDCTTNPDAMTQFSQDAQLTSFVSCLSSQINNILSNDSTLQKLSNDADATNKTVQKGIGDAISGILDSLTGPIKYIVIAVAIVITMIVIGLVIFLLSPAGQKASESLAAAGAAKIASS